MPLTETTVLKNNSVPSTAFASAVKFVSISVRKRVVSNPETVAGRKPHVLSPLGRHCRLVFTHRARGGQTDNLPSQSEDAQLPLPLVLRCCRSHLDSCGPLCSQPILLILGVFFMSGHTFEAIQTSSSCL